MDGALQEFHVDVGFTDEGPEGPLVHVEDGEVLREDADQDPLQLRFGDGPARYGLYAQGGVDAVDIRILGEHRADEERRDRELGAERVNQRGLQDSPWLQGNLHGPAPRHRAGDVTGDVAGDINRKCPAPRIAEVGLEHIRFRRNILH